MGGAWLDEPALTMCVTYCEDAVVVRVRGEIDLATRAEFEHQIEVACAGEAVVWLDLLDVAFLDPQGARALARLQCVHRRLRIGSASVAVRRSAEIVELIDGVGSGPVLDADADPDRDVAPR